MLEILNPQVSLYASAGCIAFIRNQKPRLIIVVCVLLFCIFYALKISSFSFLDFSFDGLTIRYFAISKTEKLLLISLMAVSIALMLNSINVSKYEQISYLLYMGSGFGVLIAQNLASMIVSAELMAISALPIIAFGEHHDSLTVRRYAAIHFFAGALILIGLSSLKTDITTCQINLDSLKSMDRAYFFIFIGLLINCGCAPMFSWISDSYTKSSIYGNAVLACFTTKASAYVLMKIFLGSDILFYLGIFTCFTVLPFAILEKDAKKLLNYGLIGQMGLLISGISFSGDFVPIGITMQIGFGAVYQSLLFIILGLVYQTKEKFNLHESETGLWRKMPYEAICCAIAIFAMTGIPGTVIFVSKLMITSNLHQSHEILYIIFTILNVAFFIVVGLKFFWLTFLRTYSGINTNDNIDKSNLAQMLQNMKSWYRRSLSWRRKKHHTAPSLTHHIESCAHNENEQQSSHRFTLNDYTYKILNYTSLILLVLLLIIPVFFVYNFTEGLKISSEDIRKQIIFAIGSIAIFFITKKVLVGKYNFIMDMDWIYRVFLLHIILLLQKFILFTCQKIVSITSIAILKAKSIDLYRFEAVRYSAIICLLLITGAMFIICLNP